MRTHLFHSGPVAGAAALLALALVTAGCWASHDAGASPCGACETECCEYDFRTGERVAPFCLAPRMTCREAPASDAGPWWSSDALLTIPDAGHDAPGPLDAGLDCSDPAPLLRACVTHTDCTMVHHLADCCGTGAWTGVHVDGLDAAAEYFAACEADLPACGCAGRPTLADDGSDETTPSPWLHVTCVAGSCRTSYVSMR